jgi:hypothetical protein
MRVLRGTHLALFECIVKAWLISILISTSAHAQLEKGKTVALVQPGGKTQVAQELHADAHERDLDDDLPGRAVIDYKGTTAFGKSCRMRLTANAYGDITDGRIQSDSVSLDLNSRSIDLSKVKVRYHLPSRRMFEIGDEAQYITGLYSMTSRGKNVALFPPTGEKANSCGVTLELRKAGGKLIGFSVYRNCSGEFFTHVTMCNLN